MLRKALQAVTGSGKKVDTPAITSTHMTPHKWAQRRRYLMRKESKIGATLFGTVPKGHTREFFCFDEHTWIWYEEWFDQATKSEKSMTVRYEFQPRGVLKIVDNVATGYVQGEELKYLLESMRTYYKRVSREVYGVEPAVI